MRSSICLMLSMFTLLTQTAISSAAPPEKRRTEPPRPRAKVMGFRLRANGTDNMSSVKAFERWLRATLKAREKRRLTSFKKGKPRVGRLRRSAIIEVIRRQRYSLLTCYTATLRKSPQRQRGLRLEFRITATGRVTKPMIHQSFTKDKTFLQCLKRRLSLWLFPQPIGGGEVAVKYTFFPKFRSR